MADTERAGRWIVAPRKGAQFIGTRERARARARGRRRRIVAFLLEAAGISSLMALFPPLRPLLFAAVAFAGLLVAYVCLLVAVRRNERDLARMRQRFEAEARRTVPVPVPKPAAVRTHRRSLRPISEVIHLEDVHVTIRPARELQPASAQ